MKILLLGAGPRYSWVRSLLEDSGVGTSLQIVGEVAPQESLAAVASQPVDALIVVDHFPFAAGVPVLDHAELDQALRGEAQRAVLAYELAGRAERTLVLEGSNPQAWVSALHGFLANPRLMQSVSTCPQSLPRVDSSVTPLLSAYLDPLFAALSASAPLVLVWPREAFLDGDAPGAPLPATVEVAGRARILAYGPYLPLPEGRWSATVYLGFSPDIGRLPFIIEIDVGGEIARGFFEADRGGFFSLNLDFEVVHLLHPIEVRLISQEAALEGHVALVEVSLVRAPERAS